MSDKKNKVNKFSLVLALLSDPELDLTSEEANRVYDVIIRNMVGVLRREGKVVLKGIGTISAEVLEPETKEVAGKELELDERIKLRFTQSRVFGTTEDEDTGGKDDLVSQLNDIDLEDEKGS